MYPISKTFELTRRDAFRAPIYQFLRNGQIRLIVLGVLLFQTYSAFMHPQGRSISENLLFALLISLPAVIAMALMLLLIASYKALTASPALGSLGRMQVSFDEQGIREESENVHLGFRWPAVKRILHTQQLIAVSLEGMPCLICVPRSAFDSQQEYDAFYLALVECKQQKKGALEARLQRQAHDPEEQRDSWKD
ncbi:YcxB family protein [Aquipseudomonas alcaligenes]|uniref:YcxB family protein n=1 Tax=Pseudomonas solani TaxID=2731552 RepID=UPI003D6C0089